MAGKNELKQFGERWERVDKLYQLVGALDKSEDYEDSFQGYWRDFTGFLQTEHEAMTGEVARLIPTGDVGAQLNFSKTYFNRYRQNSLNYGLDNLEELVDALGEKVMPLAVSIVPIKDKDMDKADNLERLIKDYGDNTDILKRNLRNIDPGSSEVEKEKYENQEKTIKEYEEFKSLLKDYKGLVKNILGYNKLLSYVGGKDREPNIRKMKELHDGYLTDILNTFKDDRDKYDDNAPIVETIKYLSNDSKFLARYYAENILKPAEKKLNSVAEKSDLKKYIKRNVRVMNTNKQIQFFDIAYALSKEQKAA